MIDGNKLIKLTFQKSVEILIFACAECGPRCRKVIVICSTFVFRLVVLQTQRYLQTIDTFSYSTIIHYLLFVQIYQIMLYYSDLKL